MRYSVVIACLVLISGAEIFAQCTPKAVNDQSNRRANYEMFVKLDTAQKMVTGQQKITYLNLSPDTLKTLRFYMYINAFKNTNSTFLKGAGSSIFGERIENRDEDSWGWIRADNIEQGGEILSHRFIQPNDGNKDDETVMEVDLLSPLYPGATLYLDLSFTAKLPRLLVRTGYGRNNFYSMTHWFPQLGVYEKNQEGAWGWNCHQFFRQTEFYADFGNYKVRIEAPENLVIGASGCLLERRVEDGMQFTTFEAQDVIDFAWAAYPEFIEIIDRWEHVEIHLLVPPEHANLTERFLEAAKYSLEFMHEHVGTYPYSTLTIMDPPFHSLRSGFMEYPSFITVGSFHYFSGGIRTLESLVAHEFCHQYFMAVLANNEKEEAWLDEGLVTYFEDRLMEHYYGEDQSLFCILGYTVGNREFSRREYVALPNPSVSPIALPGWELKEGRKGLIYSKTATMLVTLEKLIGVELMDEIFKTYFEEFKFSHPKGKDFLGVVHKIAGENGFDHLFHPPYSFFDQILHGTGVCDYAVGDIIVEKEFKRTGFFGTEQIYDKGGYTGRMKSKVKLYRYGEVILPVEVAVFFEDGGKEIIEWDGVERIKEIEFSSDTPVEYAIIDPENKIPLDVDLVNNSFCRGACRGAKVKAVSRLWLFFQSMIQTLSFLA